MTKFNFRQPYLGFNAIIRHNDKFLMVKEADGPGKNKWNFPGGRWDQKESILDGITREVLEETGYKFRPLGILGLYSKFKNRPSFTVVALQIIFIGEITGNQKKIAEDILEVKFFSSSDILAMSSNELFDMQYKEVLSDFYNNKTYPLEMIKHIEFSEPDYGQDSTI